jgi:peptidoglycan/LPS O-acetylase OafA/YrhL
MSEATSAKAAVLPEERGNGSYIYGVDLIRFLAAILVAFFHLTWLQESTSTLDWYGWIGVQIFFVISGFVIARSASNVSPVRFLQSRVLRLYPAAWICAVISLTITLCINHRSAAWAPVLRQFAASLTLYPTGPFLATAYWTLPIEITFYLLIFLILVAKWFRYIERVAFVMAALSSAYVMLLSLNYAGSIDMPFLNFGYDGWKNLTLLRHGIYFSCGIFLWLWSERRLSPLGIAGIILCFVIGPFEITCRSLEIIPLMPTKVIVSQACFVPVFIWFLSCGLIVAACRWRRAVSLLPPQTLTCFRWIGLMTYPLYLLHEVVGKAARHVFVGVGLTFLPSVILALGVVAIIAFAVAYAGEPALRRMMRRWLFARRAGALSSPVPLRAQTDTSNSSNNLLVVMRTIRSAFRS